MSSIEVIGIDHGWSTMKTNSQVFATGVKEIANEPPINHPILGTWGGHCGYSVRPSERGKGYAKEMLRLNILNAKSLKIPKHLVTCDANNKASEKVILANGGIYENTIDVDGCQMKRYWIEV